MSDLEESREWFKHELKKLYGYGSDSYGHYGHHNSYYAYYKSHEHDIDPQHNDSHSEDSNDHGEGKDLVDEQHNHGFSGKHHDEHTHGKYSPYTHHQH